MPKVIPTIGELLSGTTLIEGVRDPRISDLLGRWPVKTDIGAVKEYLSGQADHGHRRGRVDRLGAVPPAAPARPAA